MKGSLIGREPAAMIALSKLTVVASPSPSTRMLLGPVNLPKPLTTVTLRILAIPPRPPVSWSTTFLSDTDLADVRLWLAEYNACSAIAFASSITLETWRRNFPMEYNQRFRRHHQECCNVQLVLFLDLNPHNGMQLSNQQDLNQVQQLGL